MGEEDVHVAVDEEHDEDREEGGGHQHEQFQPSLQEVVLVVHKEIVLYILVFLVERLLLDTLVCV